jgi:thioredoxin-related protein
MLLHTDNSKIEQLFKSPKPTDYTNYPDFFDALNQCRQKEDNVDIQVKRVRGHTTRYEQQQCLTKCEFAKVDRQVRQKLRQHIRRIYLSYEQIHSHYRCGTKNSRNMNTVDYGATFMMTSIPKILLYF